MNRLIASSILANIQYTPTTDQEVVAGKLSGFVLEDSANKIFLLKGYAGTGKSTVVSALVSMLHKVQLKSVLLGPTGRATKVLSAYCGKPAQTIHKKIYFPEVTPEGHLILRLKENKHKNTIFIIDEASMIPGPENGNRFGNYTGRNLLEDIIHYVYNQHNCMMILVGDGAQLPPVGLEISPALDEEFIRSNFYLSLSGYELKQVVRQAEHSGILRNATKLREHIRLENYRPPFPIARNSGDVCFISSYEMEELLYDAYATYGEDEVVVICRSNKRANLFNRTIRSLVHGREEKIAAGDRIMIVKNNYFWLTDSSAAGFIANGEMAEVERIRRMEERFGFHFADLQIRLIDYPDIPSFEVKVLLDTLDSEHPALPWEQYRMLFDAVLEDYTELTSRKKRMEAVRNNPYFNALQIKYAYALTCHKTQGGQWKCVFVDQGYMIPEQINKEFLRWLYTAVTRASEQLYLVNFSPWLFETEEA